MESLFQLAMVITGIGAFVGSVGLIGLIVTALLGIDKHLEAFNQWRTATLWGFACVGMTFCIGLGVCFGVG